MQAHAYQPNRRAVLRAGSVSLTAIVAALCAANQAAATSSGPLEAHQPKPGQQPPNLPDHRHIIGLL